MDYFKKKKFYNYGPSHIHLTRKIGKVPRSHLHKTKVMALSITSRFHPRNLDLAYLKHMATPKLRSLIPIPFAFLVVG